MLKSCPLLTTSLRKAFLGGPQGACGRQHTQGRGSGFRTGPNWALVLEEGPWQTSTHSVFLQVQDIKFQASSGEEKESWMKALNEGISHGKNKVFDEVMRQVNCCSGDPR